MSTGELKNKIFSVQEQKRDISFLHSSGLEHLCTVTLPGVQRRDRGLLPII